MSLYLSLKEILIIFTRLMISRSPLWHRAIRTTHGFSEPTLHQRVQQKLRKYEFKGSKLSMELRLESRRLQKRHIVQLLRHDRDHHDHHVRFEQVGFTRLSLTER